MQYVIDTLNIEISRLHKSIRKLKTLPPRDDQEHTIEERITEMEGQVRELRKAISVLKDFARNNTGQYSSSSQYTSKLTG
jgi:hypothetical protein